MMKNLQHIQSDDEFDHNAAVGFISLWGLPTKVYSMVNQKKVEAMSKLWGGRFTEKPEHGLKNSAPPSPLISNWLAEDIEGSIAHVTMLSKAGILPEEEARKSRRASKFVREKRRRMNLNILCRS